MEGETTRKHRAKAPHKLKAAVLTVSDSKFDYLWKSRVDNGYSGVSGEESEDLSGELLVEGLRGEGHDISFYTVLPDHRAMIKSGIDFIVEKYSPDFIVTTGGTGISPWDVTIEAARELYHKEIDGFGEYFRERSFQEIGSAGMLSRASAGVYSGTVIFSLPGSPRACKLGLELIGKEAGHLVKHLRE